MSVVRQVEARRKKRLRRLKRAVAAAMLAWTAVTGSMPLAAETLRQALTSTYQGNPRLDAERARLRATDEEVPRVMSGFRPTILGSADTGTQTTSTRPRSTSDGRSNPSGYEVSVKQPVFSGFRTINGLKEAEATVRAGREALRQMEQTVLLEAVTAYADVVRDMALVRVREQNVSVLTQALRAAESRLAVREVTRTDVAQAQARQARALSQLDLARANLKTSRAVFERVVGHAPVGLVEPSPATKLLPHTIEEAIDIALKEHPNVGVALYREQAARATVDKIWGELLPEVRLEASYQQRFDPSVATRESEAATISGRLSVPFYQGGEVEARVRQAKHTHVSRLQEIEQAKTETQAALVTAWSKYQAALGQLKSDGVQVRASRIALEGVTAEEKVGQRTLLDVLNAQQELLDAEVTLLSTKRDVVVTSFTALAALGRLTAEPLQLGEDIYEPREHYEDTRGRWFGISITHQDGRREQIDAADVDSAPVQPDSDVRVRRGTLR